jgi:hypothetical protein
MSFTAYFALTTLVTVDVGATSEGFVAIGQCTRSTNLDNILITGSLDATSFNCL